MGCCCELVLNFLGPKKTHNTKSQTGFCSYFIPFVDPRAEEKTTRTCHMSQLSRLSLSLHLIWDFQAEWSSSGAVCGRWERSSWWLLWRRITASSLQRQGVTIKSVGKNCIFIRLFSVKNNVYTVINNTHLGLDISFYISILFFT